MAKSRLIEEDHPIDDPAGDQGRGGRIDWAALRRRGEAWAGIEVVDPADRSPPAPEGRRPRSRAAERAKFVHIVHAAARAFAEYGFARTQIADIAFEAGVSAGSLYRYAVSKEALFDLAVAASLLPDDEFLPPRELPWTNGVDSTLANLETCADWRFLFPALAALLDQPARQAPLTDLVDALWNGLHGRRTLIRIAERSHREWPRVATLLFGRVREPMLARLAFRLEHAAGTGEITLDRSPLATARHMLGFAAWSAVRRPHAGGGVVLDDDDCRAITRQLLVRGLTRSA